VESKLSAFQFIGDADLAAVPLDVAIEAQYARSLGQASARISARGATVASVTSNLEMGPDVLIGASEDGSWTLSSEVDFDQFPINTFAPLVGAPLAGRVDGRVRLNDWHHAAKLLVSLSSDELHIGQAVTSKTRFELAASNGKLTANAALQQVKGQLDIRVSTGVGWGAAWIPTLNSETPVQARVRARTFDLSGLGHLPGISEIGGTLDADMTLAARAGALTTGKLNGSIELRDGVVNADAVGQRLHGINALVEVSSGVARLRRLVMRGASGTLTAAATCRLAGLRPVSARAVVRIQNRDPFPVVFDGIDYGTLAGEVTLAASWRDRLKVDAVVPRLHFALAPTPPPNVQELGPDDAIEVGAVGKDGRFVALESRRKVGVASSEPEPESVDSPLDAQITVQLGDNVTISRGGSLRANVRGQTTVELGRGRPRIGGSFEISRGTVDIRGRRFKIIEATLSLNEDDPSNPVVSATAEYIASGGYVVTARFTGTMQSGRLTLTSQPSLPENQILNLIAFGTPEGPAAASTDESRAAAGVVGDEVSQGVNALIGNVTSYDISTRLDTSHEDVRPEVGVQLTEKIAVQLTLVPTQPSPGQRRDRTIVTLEYLFLPRWALETSVGDEGTSVLDLLWRYRY
jgi:translocation and assembly module TamB